MRAACSADSDDSAAGAETSLLGAEMVVEAAATAVAAAMRQLLAAHHLEAGGAAVPLDALDSTERRMRQTAAKEAAQAKIAFVKFVHAELY